MELVLVVLNSVFFVVCSNLYYGIYPSQQPGKKYFLLIDEETYLKSPSYFFKIVESEL